MLLFLISHLPRLETSTISLISARVVPVLVAEMRSVRIYSATRSVPRLLSYLIIIMINRYLSYLLSVILFPEFLNSFSIACYRWL